MIKRLLFMQQTVGAGHARVGNAFVSS
jgi:hypothetical protein